MDFASVSVLITAVLSIASIVLGAKYKLVRDKAGQLSKLLSAVIAATEDDNITEAEFQSIVAAAKALMDKPKV